MMDSLTAEQSPNTSSTLKFKIKKKKENSNGQESIEKFNVLAHNKGTVMTFHLNLALRGPRHVCFRASATM